VSGGRLRVVAIVLTVFGIGVTTYLTYTHYAGIEPSCSIAHGCEQVLTSPYAKLLGVPLSLLGLIGYVGLLGALIVDGEYGRMAAAFFALVGWGLSLYLLYRELFTIHAFCQWCLASLVTLTILTPLIIWRMLRTPAAEHFVTSA